jgi:hypothetical protein
MINDELRQCENTFFTKKNEGGLGNGFYNFFEKKI